MACIGDLDHRVDSGTAFFHFILGAEPGFARAILDNSRTWQGVLPYLETQLSGQLGEYGELSIRAGNKGSCRLIEGLL